MSPQAICADCREILHMVDDDMLPDDPGDYGWADPAGRTTCRYRIDIGHVPVPVGSELPTGWIRDEQDPWTGIPANPGDIVVIGKP